MSHDPEFNQLLETLLHGATSSERMQAAKLLGQHVEQLNDDEYMDARNALNQALSDADPMVLMEAMQSLTRYDRQIRTIRDEYGEVYGDAAEDMIHPIERAACKVCGRPEALISAGGCDREDCPYR